MIDPKNIIKNLPENEAQEYADLQLSDQLKNMQKLLKVMEQKFHL